MSNVWGLDVEGVRTLGRTLDTEAEAIETTITRLTTALSNTQWSGPDATAFRSEWESTHVRSLRNASQALRTTAQAARTNAQAQESTSQN